MQRANAGAIMNDKNTTDLNRFLDSIQHGNHFTNTREWNRIKATAPANAKRNAFRRTLKKMVNGSLFWTVFAVLLLLSMLVTGVKYGLTDISIIAAILCSLVVALVVIAPDFSEAYDMALFLEIFDGKSRAD
jgi:Ca2+/H+ antiporter